MAFAIGRNHFFRAARFDGQKTSTQQAGRTDHRCGIGRQLNGAFNIKRDAGEESFRIEGHTDDLTDFDTADLDVVADLEAANAREISRNLVPAHVADIGCLVAGGQKNDRAQQNHGAENCFNNTTFHGGGPS